MAIETINALAGWMQELGAARLLFKILSENDNSKQQIYFGGSFDVLQIIPHGEIRSEPGVRRPNYKASVDLAWIDAEGHVEKAVGAQLILYPDYPEVRLSGFLRGCSIAPSTLMQSLPRRGGRVLFLGIKPSGQILAYAVDEIGALTAEARDMRDRSAASLVSAIFVEIPLRAEAKDSRSDLLDRLWELHRRQWIAGFRLNKSGQEMPCNSPNCGGYTLEGSFGVVPNADAAPDYRGWELKAHSRNGRITLMTPEPTLGFYREHGAAAFVRKFGRQTGERQWYFTGQHAVGVECPTTRMTMRMAGYDRERCPRGTVGGGLHLCTQSGEIAAGWAFSDLLSLWARKHANAAFVPYETRKGTLREYRYGDHVRLGVGAAFERYLGALAGGVVKYDPGPKVSYDANGQSHVKARSQFRTTFSLLDRLYETVQDVTLPPS